jgi:hypothetical protein
MGSQTKYLRRQPLGWHSPSDGTISAHSQAANPRQNGVCSILLSLSRVSRREQSHHHLVVTLLFHFWFHCSRYTIYSTDKSQNDIFIFKMIVVVAMQ